MPFTPVRADGGALFPRFVAQWAGEFEALEPPGPPSAFAVEVQESSLAARGKDMWGLSL